MGRRPIAGGQTPDRPPDGDAGAPARLHVVIAVAHEHGLGGGTPSRSRARISPSGLGLGVVTSSSPITTGKWLRRPVASRPLCRAARRREETTARSNPFRSRLFRRGAIPGKSRGASGRSKSGRISELRPGQASSMRLTRGSPSWRQKVSTPAAAAGSEATSAATAASSTNRLATRVPSKSKTTASTTCSLRRRCRERCHGLAARSGSLSGRAASRRRHPRSAALRRRPQTSAPSRSPAATTRAGRPD